jgi:hypothetical protein
MYIYIFTPCLGLHCLFSGELYLPTFLFITHTCNSCMHASFHSCIHPSIRPYIHKYVMNIYIKTLVHTYIHTYMNTYIRTYTHTYIHKYIHRPTYIHYITLHYVPLQPVAQINDIHVATGSIFSQFRLIAFPLFLMQPTYTQSASLQPRAFNFASSDVGVFQAPIIQLLS